MSRNTKRKLAIFVGTSKCLIYAEAKFCASEMPGEVKYYECLRTEYCCAFGCCVSPGLLHFQHLWYYWLLVIIMFLVCSGGGWWYRYWLQGRYRAASTTIPNRSSSSRTHSSMRGPTCQAQQARITYNSSRNSILLHRMWKGPQRNGTSPAHNGSATTSTHYQNMSVVLNDAACPYYQLYGPPPSYETVIAQSRGKLSNPTSPERVAARMNVAPTNVIQNPASPQCFLYPCNPAARLNSSTIDEIPQCQSESSTSRQLENRREDVPFAHYSQHCMGNGILRQNVCMPYDYQDTAPVFGCSYHGSPKKYVPQAADKSSDTSDAENMAGVEQYTMTNSNNWDHNRSARQSILKVHEKESRSSKKGSKSHKKSENRKNAGAAVSDTSGKRSSGGSGTSSESELSSRDRGNKLASDCNDKGTSGESDINSRGRGRERSRNEQQELSSSSSSLDNTHSLEEPDQIQEFVTRRSSGNRSSHEDGVGAKEGHAEENSRGSCRKTKSCKKQEPCSRSPSSSNGVVVARAPSKSPTSPERTVEASTSPLQSNPSNNVILASFDFGDVPANQHRRPPVARENPNSNLESKKLDRSRSLD